MFCHVFHSVLFVGDLLFKMASKCKVLSKSKKTVMCLTEKIRMLDKIYSGMRYSAVGCELNINETMCIK